MPISHDQNFKNLILDYPRQALAFFAGEVASDVDASTRITPIRQEQLKDRLGDRFFELDTPLLVEWPDGRREACLFLLEEESDPRRFSIYRLVSYCATVAELCQTHQVVPVVIFLKASRVVPRSLSLGVKDFESLRFRYIASTLAEMPASEYLHSRNLVARLNLPSMQWTAGQKVEVYGQAVRGLFELEPDLNRQSKYLDYIDMYLQLDDNEQKEYAKRYPREKQIMETWSERHLKRGIQQGLQQGMQQGIHQGVQQGQQALLAKLLRLRFGELDAQIEQKLRQAGEAELGLWAERVLDARSLEDVFRVQ